MNITRRVEVFVWHESPLVRAGLAATLAERSDLQVTVAPWSEGPASGPGCDVIVADYASAMHCLEVLSTRSNSGGGAAPRVMVVTARDGEWDIRNATTRGAQGYLLLGCSADRIIDAVSSLARGARFYDDAVSARIADSLVHASLTKREHDVLQQMSQGAGNKEIARTLDIQLGTVKAHVKAILGKLQARSRTQAVVVAEHRGLLRMMYE